MRPTLVVSLATSAALCWVFVFLVRLYAIRRNIVDYPIARSSHTSPTPRMGGVGFVAAILVAFAVAEGRALPEWRVGAALFGILLTAWIGWLDDRHTIDVKPRLSVHMAAAASMLPLALSPTPVPAFIGVAAGLWWIIWGVASINVVNFMDGIDGLMGAQALVFGAHLIVAGVPNAAAYDLGIALVGAATGFLWWNWAPAKIFLGDAGSGALGLAMALGGLLLLREGPIDLVRAYLPLYPLFLDATVTLLRRAARGERLTQAHRSHLYQQLANGGMGHARVSLLYAAAALLGLAVTQLPSERGGTIAMVVYFLVVPAVALRLVRTVLVAPTAMTQRRKG
ncbi:MAG: MraY family glycosyltransferase [Gemmatimonadaceae bacterium]